MIWTYFCYDNITEHFIHKNQEFTCPFAIWMDLWSTGKHFYQYSRSYYDIPRPFDSHFDWKKELMSGALKWAWTGASAHSGAPRSTGGNSITWSHGIKKFHMGGLHYDYNNNQSPYILDSKTFVLAFDFNKLLTLKKYTAKWSQRLKCSTQTGLNNISKKDKWCLHVCTEMHYVNVLITHKDKDSLLHLKSLNNKTGYDEWVIVTYYLFYLSFCSTLILHNNGA